MHRPVAIGAGRVRFGVDEGPGVGEDFAAQQGEASQLVPAVGEVALPEVPEKHGHVVIRIFSGLAARAGAEQHDALDALAVQLIESGAQALQDRVGGAGGEHRTFPGHRCPL